MSTATRVDSTEQILPAAAKPTLDRGYLSVSLDLCVDRSGIADEDDVYGATRRETAATSEEEDVPVRKSIRRLAFERHRDYFHEHKVERIYECLLTALSVDQPSDPRAWLREKIPQLRSVYVSDFCLYVSIFKLSHIY